MNPDTFAETIGLLLDRETFHPFTPVMNDGTQLEVDHPQALAYREGTAMFVGPGGKPHLFNSESVNRVVGCLAEREAA